VNGGTGPELLFNYRTEHNAMWDDVELRAEFGYRTTYPEGGAPGLVVDL
jgi:hypothetical protein